MNRLFQKHSGLKRDQGEKRRQQEGQKAAGGKFDNQKKWIKSNRKADGFLRCPLEGRRDRTIQ